MCRKTGCCDRCRHCSPRIPARSSLSDPRYRNAKLSISCRSCLFIIIDCGPRSISFRYTELVYCAFIYATIQAGSFFDSEECKSEPLSSLPFSSLFLLFSPFATTGTSSKSKMPFSSLSPQPVHSLDVSFPLSHFLLTSWTTSSVCLTSLSFLVSTSFFIVVVVLRLSTKGQREMG
ncbi:hypothetical protein EDD21DRAFT_144413 [Dissophora ornata]|nr:hypothetical protein EDD21DRAFT_144413 [Dissophora ornata]